MRIGLLIFPSTHFPYYSNYSKFLHVNTTILVIKNRVWLMGSWEGRILDYLIE